MHLWKRIQLDFLYLTEIYRPRADYLNMDQNSDMSLLEMQVYVWRCLCVYVRGGEGLFVCMCVGWEGGGG